VGDIVNFTLTVRNVGTAPVTGDIGVFDLLPACFDTDPQSIKVSRTPTEAPAVTPVTNGGVTREGVSVVYTGQAVNETVTVTIAARVTCVPAAGQNVNTAFVLTEENSQADEPTNNGNALAFTVAPAASTAPSASATARPTTSATARPTVQPSGTARPTAKPSTPAGLPDTGAGSTTTLVLGLVAGALLASGVAAQAVLRRRTR
jgi:uncharacterized repeat protein (TIGR01451 family)